MPDPRRPAGYSYTERGLRVESSSPPRSVSPPQGTVQVRGKGWKVNLPAVVVTGLLSAAVGAFGGQRAGTATEVSASKDAILVEVGKMLETQRRDLANDMREAVVPLQDSIRGLENRERKNIPILAAVANKLGSNLRWGDGSEPDVEFHSRPLNPKAPPVQPKETLIAPP